MQAAEGDGIARAVEGEPAHQVDGGLEHRHPVQHGATGHAERDELVAAGHIAPERAAEPCPPLGGKHGLPGPVTPHEHTVVVSGVLVEQAQPDEAVDDAGADAPPPQVGAYSPAAAVGRGEGEWPPLLPGRRPRAWYGRGRGAARRVVVERQQIADCLGERHPAEMPDKRDGVAAGGFRVAVPGAPVLDAQAVYLLGGVVAADPPDVIAEAGQQIGQIRVIGGVDLRARIVPVRRAAHRAAYAGDMV